MRVCVSEYLTSVEVLPVQSRSRDGYWAILFQKIDMIWIFFSALSTRRMVNCSYHVFFKFGVIVIESP